jgi:hypothetical protein
MPSKTWGTPLTVKQYVVVGENEEIPSGEYAYVKNEQVGEGHISAWDWVALVNSDLSVLRNQIENSIPHCKVQWISISWDSAVTIMPYLIYHVKGLKIEAIVKNEGASLTGAEIVLIILAVAIFIAIFGAIVMAGWVTWRIMLATEQIGPWATILVGGAVLAGIGIFLYLVLGGKAEYRGRKRRVRLG